MDSGIFITYYQLNFNLELIDNILNEGWTINDHGKILYLPIGDEDYDWQTTQLTDWDLVKSIILQKIHANEIIGLALTFQDTNIGGIFLFDLSSKTITISTEINRVLINGTDLTNYSWYLSKLTSLFDKDNVIEFVECKDYNS